MMMVKNIMLSQSSILNSPPIMSYSIIKKTCMSNTAQLELYSALEGSACLDKFNTSHDRLLAAGGVGRACSVSRAVFAPTSSENAALSVLSCSAVAWHGQMGSLDHCTGYVPGVFIPCGKHTHTHSHNAP